MTGVTDAASGSWSPAAARERLPVLVFAVIGSGLIATQWLERGNRPFTLNFITAEDAAFATLLFAAAALGLLILMLHPRHGTGWLLLIGMGTFTLAVFCHAVAVRLLLVSDHDRWLGQIAAWPATFLVPAAVGLLVLAPATWPSGRIEVGWRRDLAKVAIVTLVVSVLSQAFAPDPLDGVEPSHVIANPLGIPAAGPAAAMLATTASLLLAVYLGVAVVDLVRRTVVSRGAVARVLAAAAAFVVLGATGAVAHQRIGDGAWLLLLVVAGVLAAAAVASYVIRTQRRSRELEMSRHRIVAEREDERRRLRADLHDGLGPVLAALRLELDAPSDPALQRANALLNDAIIEVRRISRDLRPVALDDLGLAPALEQVATNLSAPHGPTITVVTAPAPLPRLPAPVEVAAFRIVSEALTNVVRHAEATRTDVRLTLSSLDAGHDVLIVDVVDDGTGLTEAASTAGLGLRSIRERADELGGNVEFAPAPTGGTHIRATLPVAS